MQQNGSPEKPRKRKHTTGIVERHSRSCAGQNGGVRCTCSPTYRAWVWDKKAPVVRDGVHLSDTDGKLRYGEKIFQTFPTLAAAKAWRQDALPAVKRRELQAPSKRTLREAAEEWLEGARTGAIRTRSGDPFKPSTLHGYKQTLHGRILPELGGARLSDIDRADLQDLAERMLADGKDPSTIRNALMPLRAIFGRAIHRKEVAVNPTSGLQLPAVRGRRDRIVSPPEATRLLSELPEVDRALWATALYAGLRRGELLALRWDDVDLAAGLIRVERSYDPRSGETVAPKSRAGVRRVPITPVLRDYLDAHKTRSEWSGGLVFGRTPDLPFNHSSIIRRTEAAWRDAAVERARAGGAHEDELKQVAGTFVAPLTLHEARHTCASIFIAAGVNVKALSSYLGHSSIQITFDRYGHLMPGNEDEAAELVDAYLARADTQARLAQLGADTDET